MAISLLPTHSLQEARVLQEGAGWLWAPCPAPEPGLMKGLCWTMMGDWLCGTSFWCLSETESQGPLYCLFTKAFLIFTFRKAGCGTCCSAQILTRSVYPVFFFVVTFSAAECPQMLPCSSPWQKSWLRKIILAKPTIFSIIFWLKMLIHPSRPTTYVSASILQRDFL